ncbi:SMI1/KNR4 family protein [Paenibacillus daejeonensis]|uniref:SMI1/KNR4 family protein n=1 Tax=Paenibacillus daejeonensis TaxID=135193 RepID=UPI00037BF83D|nr:SMI1/KNR4 family protein [Paenibacillus daejeonensis]
MYEQLSTKLANTKAIRWFPGHGTDEASIAEAETELGFALPPSYRWWLLHYNSGHLNGGDIFGLAPAEHRDIADNDVLYNYRLHLEDEDWRRQFPSRLDLFIPDADELFFFDTSARDEQGEFPVMCFDLINAEIFEYAPTFAAFLEQLIDEREGGR